MGDTDTVLVKDTLGRPMRLGQLYDCRKDNPEDGASLPLWKEEDMKNGTRTLYNSGTSYSIDVEDVSSSRLSKTSMNADLKMSVCCGLASGRGSGKYVEETSSSKREVRATLEYKYVSRFEELTMDTITAQTLENMLRYRLATHVVTGVEYGVNMMFTFIKKYEDEKDYMDLRANIKAKVFWFIKVADVDYHDYRGSDRLKVKKDDLSIKYHGDVKAAPKTLEEAVILFKKVTEAIGMHKKESNNDACTIELDDKIIKFKPVAKRVWLMPLTVIDSNAPKLARTISNKLATRVQTILDGIHRLVLEAQDLKERCERDLFLQEKDGKKFYLADIPNQIDRFLEAKNKHTMQLKKGLKELLPKIREEQDRSEDELSQKLYEMMRGPFDMDKLNKWVEDKEAEAMTLVKLLRMIKKPGITKAFTPDKYQEYMRDLPKDAVVHILQLNFPPMGFQYIRNMEAYINNKLRDVSDISEECWYKDARTILRLRTMVRELAEDQHALVTTCMSGSTKSIAAIFKYTHANDKHELLLDCHF